MNAQALTVALGEYDTGWHDQAVSLDRADDLAQRARANGADVLVLPEMCLTGFTMDAQYAEPQDGPSIDSLSSIAATHNLWIVAGVSMRRGGKHLNSALTFAPDGLLAATYDKRKLFDYAKESTVYSAGTAPCIIEINGVSLALFICFELRFPELFRQAAPDADALVIIANWPAAREKHWEVLTRARAIENQCYVIAVNRIGEADGIAYKGGSVIVDPWGERIDKPSGDATLRTGGISHAAVEEVRKAFPLPHPKKG